MSDQTDMFGNDLNRAARQKSIRMKRLTGVGALTLFATGVGAFFLGSSIVQKGSTTSQTTVITGPMSPTRRLEVAPEFSPASVDPQTHTTCLSSSCVSTAGTILAKMDHDVSVCDDAYHAMCGGWLRDTKLPSDMTSIDSSFSKVNIETRDTLRTMVEGWGCPAPGHVSTEPIQGWRDMAGCMYQTCMAVQNEHDGAAKDSSAHDVRHTGAPLVAYLKDKLPFIWDTIDAPSHAQLALTTATLPTYMARLMAHLHANSVASMVGFFSHQHPTEPGQGNVMYIVASGLGLSFDFYDSPDSQAAALRKSYLAHIGALFRMLDEARDAPAKNQSEYAKRADAVLDFERRLKKISLSPTQSRDTVATTNVMTIDEAAALAAPSFDLGLFISLLKEWGVFPSTTEAQAKLSGDAEVVIDHPSFYKQLAGEVIFPADLGHHEAVKILNDYVLFRAIRRTVGSLGGPWKEETERHASAMSGAKAQENWKECLGLVRHTLSWVVGEGFVTLNGDAEAKSRADFAQEILDEVREVFRGEVGKLDWMDATTAERALEKERKLKSSLGFPHWLLDHNRTGDYFKSFFGTPTALKDAILRDAEHSSAFEIITEAEPEGEWPQGAGRMLSLDVHLDREGLRYGWSDLGRPMDKDLWAMTPDTVNAYYLPSANEIVFPDSILRPPFMDTPKADDSPTEQLTKLARSYGAFGAVVGHEISHAFDDQGSTMDGDGRLVDWWTPEARAGFEAASNCIVEQYNSFGIPELAHAQEPVAAGRASAGGLRGPRRIVSHDAQLEGGQVDIVEQDLKRVEVMGADGARGVALQRIARASANAHEHSHTPGGPTSIFTAEAAASSAPKVNGQLTLGENIADAGGLRLSLIALERHIARTPHLAEALASASTHAEVAPMLLPGLNMSPAQLAVINFGQVWCTKATPHTARSRAASDPHAPGSSRVVGSLLNLPGAAEILGCPADARFAGEGLLAASETPKKCQVW